MAQRYVLIVEDEMLVGMDIAEELERNGISVAGPFSTVEDAERATEGETPAAALLDINLGSGRTSAKLADQFRKNGVPFSFLSGYGENGPEWTRFQGARKLSKPVRPADLVAEARRLLSDA
jgi:DNA-binding response OmpR family regulator